MSAKVSRPVSSVNWQSILKGLLTSKSMGINETQQKNAAIVAFNNLGVTMKKSVTFKGARCNDQTKRLMAQKVV